MFRYKPKFHLRYRPGPQVNTPSFMDNLDGILTVEEQVKNVLKGVVPPVRNLGPPETRLTTHNESIKSFIEAVQKRL